jgi:uncharacterized membrane protein
MPSLTKRFPWNQTFFAIALLSAFLIRPIFHAPVRSVVVAAVAVTALVLPADAEARRFGGGRSFGFRGSRGFSRAFGRRAAFGRRSGSGMGGGYRRGFGGFGFPFLMGMGLGGFGGLGFGLLRMLFIPMILFFVLRMMSARR